MCLYKTSEVFMGIDLITKTEYKAYVGINSTNQDTEIDFLIPKVSEFVKTYCRRSFIDFIDEVKSEIFQGGFKQFLLKETPVTQVLSVAYSQDFGKTYTNLVKFTDWVQIGDSIMSTSTVGFAPVINGYRVNYFAGYEDGVPADLKLAVLDLVTYYRKNDQAIHSSKGPGSNSVQIEYISSTTIPAHIRRVLDQYMADYT
jgi:hypothetical protein